MRATIPWAVMVGAAGVFASVVLRRGPMPEPDLPRADRGRSPSISVREGRDECAAPSPGASLSVVGPRRDEPGKTLPERTLAVPVAPAPVEGFWEDLGALLETRSSVGPEAYRQEILSRTADYLGLDPSRASSFQDVALQSLTAIQDAWRARDAEVLSLPESLDLEERDRREQEIQDRYEAAKRRASDRLESQLDATARHEQFRLKLGEWIDAVR